jgi:hypothetical protein
MNIEKYKEYLLSRIPSARVASGGKVINCRCFECPDSADPRSAHFYISIPKTQEEPSLYYCHKCHCSGVVTFKKLIEWGIYDDQVAIELVEYNKNCSMKPKNQKYYNRQVYTLYNQVTTQDETTALKLSMINQRLGTNFDYRELQKLKIVLNLNDLLKYNHINYLSRKPDIVNELDSNFMGFISIDNAFLNMRRLCDEGLVSKEIDKRYINYKIFDKFDTSQRFYTVPTKIDLSIPQRTKIHIAEGPFDILSIYKNLRHEEVGIYTSIAGSNYEGLSLYFLETFKLPYVEFHYYPDNDKFGSKNVMDRVCNNIGSITQAPIYIHRNMYPGEKDFGVSLNKIQESIYQQR